MNTKQFAAAVIGATLIAGAILPLAACSGGEFGAFNTTTINIADYATEYDGSAYSKDGYTTANSVLSCGADGIVETYGTLHVYKSGNTYNVFDLVQHKSLLINLPARPQFISVASTNSNNIGAITVSGNGISKAYYFTADGTEMLPDDNYESVTSRNVTAYIYGESEPSSVVVICYILAGQSQTQEVYFQQITDKDTGAVTYEKIYENVIRLCSDDYGTGADVSGLYTDLYPYSEDKPVKGEMRQYQVGALGSKLRFFRSGVQVGEIDMRNARMLTYMDNYLYYYTLLPVSATAQSGYNYVVQTSGATSSTVQELKYNYRLYRYDILKNKTEKLNLNAVIFSMARLYNYTEKCYDAGAVWGYEMFDGVANTGSDMFCYLVDKKLNAVFDCTELGLSASSEIYNLGNGIYSIGSYMFDGNFNVLSRIGSVYFKNENLVSFMANNCYGLADIRGTVVVEPRYTGSFTFYGGVAYANEIQTDGSTKGVFLLANGYTRDVPESTEYVTVSVGAGYYTTVTERGENVSEFCLYNFRGTLLKTINCTAAEYVSVDTFSGSTYIRYFGEEKTEYFLLA